MAPPRSAPASSSALPRALRPHKELLIAWTLLLVDDDVRYGYRLHQSLRARGLDVQATSLYRRLHTFERDRWVVSRWTASADGPRRRVYRLTPRGRRTLHEFSGWIAAMRDIYGTFLHTHQQVRAGRPDALDGIRGAAAPVPTARPLRPHKELLAGWLSLQLDAGATYGYELRREFDAYGLSPEPSTVYRMLRRFEADEWVQSRWLSTVAGPQRRFYRLTARGRRNLDEIAVLIAAIRDSHDAYLREYERLLALRSARARHTLD